MRFAIVCGEIAFRREEFFGIHKAEPRSMVQIPVSEHTMRWYTGISIRFYDVDPQEYPLIGVVVDNPHYRGMDFVDVWFLQDINDVQNMLEPDRPVKVYIYDTETLRYKGTYDGVFEPEGKCPEPEEPVRNYNIPF